MKTRQLDCYFANRIIADVLSMFKIGRFFFAEKIALKIAVNIVRVNGPLCFPFANLRHSVRGKFAGELLRKKVNKMAASYKGRNKQTGKCNFSAY